MCGLCVVRNNLTLLLLLLLCVFHNEDNIHTNNVKCPKKSGSLSDLCYVFFFISFDKIRINFVLIIIITTSCFMTQTFHICLSILFFL